MAVSENVTITVTAKGTVTVKKEFAEIGAAAKQASSGVDFMRSALQGLIAYMSVTTFVQYADAATRVGNSLKLAGLEGTAYLDIQSQLYDAAIKNGQVTEDLANVYQGISAAQETLGYTSQETMDITRGIAAAMRASTAGTSAQSGALQQLSQLMGGTKVQAQEFNSLIDGARPLLMAAAAGSDRWKGSLAALREDVKNSDVTVKEFMAALQKGLPAIEAMAGRLPLTIGQAFVSLSQSFQEWMATSYEVSTSAALISDAIQFIGANINIVMPIVIAFGTVMVASFSIAFMKSAYANFLLLGEALVTFGTTMAATTAIMYTYIAALVRAAAVAMYQSWAQSMNTARVTLAAMAVSMTTVSTAMTTTFIPSIIRSAQAFIANFIPAVTLAARTMLTQTIPAIIATGRALLANLIASVTRSAQAFTASFIPAIVAAARALLTQLIAAVTRSATAMTASMIPAIVRTAQALAVQLVVAITATIASFAKLAITLIANPFTVAIAGAAALAYAIYGITYGFDEADKAIAQFVEKGKQKIGELIAEVNKAADAWAGLGAQSPDLKIPSLANEIKKGGMDAATAIKSGMTDGANTAAKTTLSTAEQAHQIGAATLANSFGQGADTIGESVKSASTDGGGVIGAQIAANAQIMSAKFEGTGRNIYDLWNNWGNEFINSFGVTIGDLLIDFQRAQTANLAAQADLYAAQAELTMEQMKYLRDHGAMPGTAGSSTGGSNGGGTNGTKGTLNFGGSGISTDSGLGGKKAKTRTNYSPSTDTSSTGGGLSIGSNDNKGGKNGTGTGSPSSGEGRQRDVVNVWDAKGAIDALGSKRGKDALINHVKANRSEIASILGIA